MACERKAAQAFSLSKQIISLDKLFAFSREENEYKSKSSSRR